jgi:hypothetical protein
MSTPLATASRLMLPNRSSRKCGVLAELPVVQDAACSQAARAKPRWSAHDRRDDLLCRFASREAWRLDRPICFYDDSAAALAVVSALRPRGRVNLVPIGDFPVHSARDGDPFQHDVWRVIDVAPAVSGGVRVDAARRQMNSADMLTLLEQRYPPEAEPVIAIGSTRDMFNPLRLELCVRIPPLPWSQWCLRLRMKRDVWACLSRTPSGFDKAAQMVSEHRLHVTTFDRFPIEESGL